MHLFIWKNNILHFIFMNFAKLLGTENEEKIQYENMCPSRESKQ